MTKAAKRPESFVAQYMRECDVPAWFRGSSTFQMKAANDLQNALRDDREQNTVHRVTACLLAIGLKPMMDARMLRGIMKLSRGNDLAFLYGILTLFYKTPGCTKFSTNEQLIMSTICHLDMITTLRELDRIMPPGHPSKKARLARIKAEKYRRQQKAVSVGRKQPLKKPNISPYFQKLVRPKERMRKPLTVQPTIQTTITPYEAYLDPHYEEPNKHRWFTSYNVQKSKRIATKILMEELDKIFYDFDATLEKANNTEIICEKHFQEYLAERRKESEKKAAESERCLDLIEVSKYRKRIRSARVKRRLERDIECHQHRIRKEHKDTVFNVKVISGKREVVDKIVTVKQNEPFLKFFKDEFQPCTPCSSEVDIPGRYLKPCPCLAGPCLFTGKVPAPTCKCNLPPPPEVPQPQQPHICGAGGGYSTARHPIKPKPTPRACYSNPPRMNICPLDLISKMPRLAGGGLTAADCAQEDSSDDCTKVHVEEPPRLCCKRSSQFRIKKPAKTCKQQWGEQKRKRKELQRLIGKHQSKHGLHKNDTEHRGVKEKDSKTYFTAATEYLPYKFDYERIFRFDSEHDVEYIVRRAAVKVLDPDNAVPREKDGRPNVSGAAAHAFKKIFKEAALAKSKEFEEVKKDGGHVGFPDKNKPAEEQMRERYPQQYFNPDDHKLMDNMLKDAFELMKLNPHFVLATLPDAYKLPILREWLYKRYGKCYTKADRVKYLEEYNKFFSELSDRRFKIELPNFNKFKLKPNSSYKERDCLLKRYKVVEEEVYEVMENYIMKVSRDFYFAMHPNMLPNGPPVNTYFAYMPARVQDILHIGIK